jgi:hypothetical protein
MNLSQSSSTEVTAASNKTRNKSRIAVGLVLLANKKDVYAQQPITACAPASVAARCSLPKLRLSTAPSSVSLSSIELAALAAAPAATRLHCINKLSRVAGCCIKRSAIIQKRRSCATNQQN